MVSIFKGEPLKAEAEATVTSSTPQWMQDAIYDQIQNARLVAGQNFTSYDLPTVAPLSADQKGAYQTVRDAQGQWRPEMDVVSSQMQEFAAGQRGTAEDFKKAQAEYLRQDLVGKNLDAGQDLFAQAGEIDVLGNAQPLLDEAAGSARNIVGAGKGYLERAGGISAADAAQPYVQYGLGQSAMGAANPYLSQAQTTTAAGLAERALQAADPYLTSAGQTSVSDVSDYMNPYQQNVLDTIAQQGARNLSENLLPQVSDSFIRAGQYGSSQMGEMGSRALRDTQEAILKAQAPIAAQGYEGALRASAADKQRQAGLAGTVGNISGADLSRMLTGAGQFGALGSTAGQMTGADAGRALTAGSTLGQMTGSDAARLAGIGDSLGRLTSSQAGQLGTLGSTTGTLSSQQMKNLSDLGRLQTSAGQAQQTFGLDAASKAQQAQAADYSRQMSALNNLGNIAQMEQNLAYKDAGALEAAGAAQQAASQKVLTAAEKQFLDKQNYPRSMVEFMGSQIRQTPAAFVPQRKVTSSSSLGNTYSNSPLSQIATAFSVGAGLKDRNNTR
tara:strand:- start:845 stop:2515 length:1671 start_codon:yes stop_codon:yes gene_type:complete